MSFNSGALIGQFPPDIFLSKHLFSGVLILMTPGLLRLHSRSVLYVCPAQCMWLLSMSPFLASAVNSRATLSPDLLGHSSPGSALGLTTPSSVAVPTRQVALGLTPAAASQPRLLVWSACLTVTGNVLFTADRTACSLAFIS